MNLAVIGPEHAYLRGLRRALQRAGHVITVEPNTTTEHILLDGRALPGYDGDLQRVTGLIYHPDTQSQDKLRQLPRLVALSQPVADRLVDEYHVDRARVRVVAPGVDIAARAPGQPSGCHILSVGDLVPRKGHDVLLRALSRLFDLDWRLTIVGSAQRDPACTQSLVEQAAQPSLAGRVSFVDVGADDDALEMYWQSADVFALATHWEGYAMAVADALRRGLPVAVTSGGAAAALISPDAGVVCSPGDDVGLSKALRRVIFDRTLRAELREGAWAIGQTLPDWSTQAQALLAVLTS